MPLKTLALISLSALFVATASAQEAPVRRIDLDGKDGVPAPVEEIDAHGVGRIHHVPTPALEIFPSGAKPSSRGTIMICPGGGYGILAVGKEGRDVAKMLNAAGWDATVLLYPVSAGPDTRKLALGAAGKAFTLLQKRGDEFGLSVARVGVMGFSAGGHLMARLAHETPAANAPAFLVLIYPAYLEKNGKLFADVTPAAVPTFLYVGDKDKAFYPSSEAYAAACQQKGIPCDYSVAHDVGHGFGLTAQLPVGARNWPDKLKAFLASCPGRSTRRFSVDDHPSPRLCTRPLGCPCSR